MKFYIALALVGSLVILWMGRTELANLETKQKCEEAGGCVVIPTAALKRLLTACQKGDEV